MTALARGLRRLRERLLGEYYEGPDPPVRLAEMAMAFAEAHPRATRREWLQFAISHAGEAYRSGYLRGHEWAERDPEARVDVPPDLAADLVDPDWRWRTPVLTADGLAEVVPDGWPDDEQELLERMTRGGIR